MGAVYSAGYPFKEAFLKHKPTALYSTRIASNVFIDEVSGFDVSRTSTVGALYDPWYSGWDNSLFIGEQFDESSLTRSAPPVQLPNTLWNTLLTEQVTDSGTNAWAVLISLRPGDPGTANSKNNVLHHTQWNLRRQGSAVIWASTTGAGDFTLTYTLRDRFCLRQWSFLGLSYDPSTISNNAKIFFDGTLVAQTTALTGGASIFSSATESIWVGSSATDVATPMQGFTDVIAFYAHGFNSLSTAWVVAGAKGVLDNAWEDREAIPLCYVEQSASSSASLIEDNFTLVRPESKFPVKAMSKATVSKEVYWTDGKFYTEFHILKLCPGAVCRVGIAPMLGENDGSWETSDNAAWYQNDGVTWYHTATGVTLSAYQTGDIIQLAWDSQNIRWGKNGSLDASLTANGSSTAFNRESGPFVFLLSGTAAAAVIRSATPETGPYGWEYSAPSGYEAMVFHQPDPSEICQGAGAASQYDEFLVVTPFWYAFESASAGGMAFEGTFLEDGSGTLDGGVFWAEADHQRPTGYIAFFGNGGSGQNFSTMNSLGIYKVETATFVQCTVSGEGTLSAQTDFRGMAMNSAGNIVVVAGFSPGTRVQSYFRSGSSTWSLASEASLSGFQIQHLKMSPGGDQVLIAPGGAFGNRAFAVLDIEASGTISVIYGPTLAAANVTEGAWDLAWDPVRPYIYGVWSGVGSGDGTSDSYQIRAFGMIGGTSSKSFSTAQGLVPATQQVGQADFNSIDISQSGTWMVTSPFSGVGGATSGTAILIHKFNTSASEWQKVASPSDLPVNDVDYGVSEVRFNRPQSGETLRFVARAGLGGAVAHPLAYVYELDSGGDWSLAWQVNHRAGFANNGTDFFYRTQ